MACATAASPRLSISVDSLFDVRLPFAEFEACAEVKRFAERVAEGPIYSAQIRARIRGRGSEKLKRDSNDVPSVYPVS